MSGIQSHLSVTFPLKSPADRKALAKKLPMWMPFFAKAQDAEGSVHYSRFLALSDKALLFIADIDGDADELIGALAKSAGPVFDAILEHVENPPRAPVAHNTGAFVLWAKQHNTRPWWCIPHLLAIRFRTSSPAHAPRALRVVASSTRCYYLYPSSRA